MSLVAQELGPRVLLVDDEPDVVAGIALGLRQLEVAGHPVELATVSSGAAAVDDIRSRPDTAVILLDVTMESPTAGLSACRAIREELGNDLVRILICTGQPGLAPEREVVDGYDIDGYLPKGELTRDRVYAAVLAALKAHAELHQARQAQAAPVPDPAALRGLVARIQLTHLLGRFPERPLWAAFVFVNGFVVVAALALLASVTDAPFLFPSLGPTAFLFFFTPTVPTASPRNAICGHAIGVACGYAALWACGLTDRPPAVVEGVTGPRVVAAGLSIALAGAAMVLLRIVHPPAGATTLLIALGVVRDAAQLPLIMVSITLLTASAFVINRLAGIDYPLWRPAVDRPAKAPASREGRPS